NLGDWTVTLATAPVTGNGCIPGFWSPPRALVIADCPSDFSMTAKVLTEPFPDTPPDPGGRVAVICRAPVESSSRCTSETACPSCDRNPPLDTFTTCKTLG